MEFYLKFCGFILFFLYERGLASDSHGAKQHGEIDSQLSNTTFLEINSQNIKIAFDYSTMFIFLFNEDINFELHVINNTHGKEYCRTKGLKSEADITDVAATNERGINLVAIGYPKHIQIMAVETKQTDFVHHCAITDYLQKLEFDRDVRHVEMFKAYDGQHERAHMVVSLKSEKGNEQIVLFRWMASGFHKTDELLLRSITDVSVLTLKTCANPLIFITSRASPNKSSPVLIYQIDPSGKLILKQNFYMNHTLFEPFMLDCNYYNFLVCDQVDKSNSCSIYRSNAKNIEFFEERRVRINGNLRIAYAENVVVAWNLTEGSEILAFFDPLLTNSTLISPIKRSGSDTIREIYLSNDRIIIVSNDSKIAVVEASHLNLTKIHRLDDGVNSLENMTRKILGRIYSRKMFLDKIATLANQAGNRIEYLSLNKTTIESGIIKTVNISNEAVSKPQEMHEHVKSLRQDVERNKSRILRTEKRIIVNKLHVKNLLYNRSLYFDHDEKDSGKFISMASSVVTLKEAHTKRLIVSQEPKIISIHQFPEVSVPIMKVFQSIKVYNLMLHQINDINFPKLYANAFLRKRDNQINGSLVFPLQKTAPSVYCQHLTAEALNRHNTKNFFTLTTDQTVASDIFVSKFLVSNISVGSVNGMNMNKIALVGRNNSLRSPIEIHHFTISGDLALSTTNEASFADHLRITRKLDTFSQIYNGDVRISGRLVLQNLSTTARAQKYLSRHQSTGQPSIRLMDLGQAFWMKNTRQKLNTAVQFAMPIQFTQLEAASLNDKTLANYMLRSGNWSVLSRFSMQSVMMTGNFNAEIEILPANNDFISVEHLSANLIRHTHNLAELLGRKKFSLLRTMHLVSDNINSITPEDLVHRLPVNKQIGLNGSKRMGNLSVHGKFEVAHRINVEVFNQQNLSRFFMAAVNIGKLNPFEEVPKSLRTLRFIEAVKMINVTADSVNERSIFGNDFHLHDNHVEMLRLIVINADIVFRGNLKVAKLNGIVWSDYLSHLALKNDGHVHVGGVKSFLSAVRIYKNLNLDSVNDVNLAKLFKHTFNAHGSQTISKCWRFQYFNLSSLSTAAKIDGINAENLLGSNSKITIHGSLTVNSVRLHGNLLGFMHRQSAVTESMRNLRNISGAIWSEIHVRSHATWQEDTRKPTPKYQLLKNDALQSYGTQTVHGRVCFKLAPEFVITSTEYNLSGVDLKSIEGDYLSRNLNAVHTAVISGSKYFESTLAMRASVASAKVLNAEVINGIDILSLNDSVSRRPSAFKRIFGKKTFSGSLKSENLIVGGLVNSVFLTNLVYVNQTSLIGAPPVQFAHSSVIIDALNIDRINQIEFHTFVERRVKTQGERQIINGSLTFDELFTKNAVFSYINKCALERVVFKKFKNHQIVRGTKNFLRPLNIIGPSSMVNANAIDLIDKYRRSMFSNQYYKLKSLEIIGDGETIFQEGLYISSSFFTNIGSELRASNRELKKLLRDTNARRKNGRMANATHRFLYLEYERNALAKLEIAKDAGAVLDSNDCAKYCKMSAYNLKGLSIEPSPSNIDHDFQIHVANNCCENTSALVISFTQKRMSFNYSRVIENVWTFTATQLNARYIMVELTRSPENKTILLLRVDPIGMNATYVQKIILSDSGEPIFTSQLYETHSRLLLVVGLGKLRVFEFDSESGTFMESFKRQLYWNRGGVVSVYEEDILYQTIFGNYGDRKLVVYNGNASIVNQIIHVPEPLERFVICQDSQSKRNSLAIVTRNSWFHLYMYHSSVEGWLHETQGLLSNVSGVFRSDADLGSPRLMCLLTKEEPIFPSVSTKYYVQQSLI